MSSTGRLFRAVGVVSGATMLSRILGFVRDMVTAHYLGTGTAADAFFVAFRIPNLLRRLFGEGSLTASFIPVFSDYLAGGGQREARHIARATCTLLSVILVCITLAGILIAPLIIRFIAPGFTANPEKFALTVLLNRIMFPYILCISLVALAMGILNAVDHFLAPALAPVLLNICMIAAILLLGKPLASPALALAVGVVAGGVAQLLLQLPFLKRYGFTPRWRWNPRHPAIGRIGRLMGPSLIGLAITQITIFMNTLLASLLADGTVSYLYYADRLVQFPLGVFAVALGTVMLPSLSRQAAQDDWQAFGREFSGALRVLFLITIPAMIGLMVLSRPIIYLLFQRGHFSPQSTVMVSQCLVAYGAGLWAYAGLRLLVPAFYALKDARTPVMIGGLALAVNLATAIGLMDPFRHVGLALATAVSSAFNFIALLLILRHRKPNIAAARPLFRALLQAGGAGLGMAAVIHLAPHILPALRFSYNNQAADLLRLTVTITGGAVVYGLFILLLGNREVRLLAARLKRKTVSR
ncbi:MAG: murein biosynthesis integral membrane protein MurJ [Deltaproteobacteria bacterium]|nr:murein biosynthesis integral membrane protein MurJ [Candidatus Anaeroferrophillacea bacterium]